MDVKELDYNMIHVFEDSVNYDNVNSHKQIYL